MDDPISDLLASHQPEHGTDNKKTTMPFVTKKSGLIALVLLLVIAAFGGGFFTGNRFSSQQESIAQVSESSQNAASTSTQATATKEASTVTLLTLDTNKNYGDKYADGILPVGDKKYVTNAAKKGSLFLCNANFVPEAQAGAQTRGPWFVNNNTEWDIHKKSTVNGEVTWEQNITITQDGKNRIITTNNLPDHHTGEYPVASNDDAYQYDRNPNQISEQDLTYTLAAEPEPGTPQCMGGEVGVMITGVALFNAFDAGGRDAGAWEVQDTCDGHPQSAGAYHYHTLSRCIKDTAVSKVIGYALDGIPITGPKVGTNNILTTDDLDECHGIVSEIMLDDKKVTTYHYVMTEDFPYSVSCFRAKPIQPPGQQESQQGMQPNENQSAAPSAGASKPSNTPKPTNKPPQ